MRKGQKENFKTMSKSVNKYFIGVVEMVKST